MAKSQNPFDAFDPSKEEIQKAVECVRKNLTPEVMEEVREAMKDPMWEVMAHHGYGMGIRNLLRENGFEWNAIALDDLWFKILKKAVKK